MIPLYSRCSYYPHFTDEKTIRVSQEFAQKHMASKLLSCGLNPAPVPNYYTILHPP